MVKNFLEYGLKEVKNHGYPQMNADEEIQGLR